LGIKLDKKEHPDMKVFKAKTFDYFVNSKNKELATPHALNLL